VELFSGRRCSGNSFWRLVLSRGRNFAPVRNFEPGGCFAVVRGFPSGPPRSRELCVPVDSGEDFESTGGRAAVGRLVFFAVVSRVSLVLPEMGAVRLLF